MPCAFFDRRMHKSSDIVVTRVRAPGGASAKEEILPPGLSVADRSMKCDDLLSWVRQHRKNKKARIVRHA